MIRLLALALLLPGCNLFGDDCGLPRQDQNPTVFVNANGGGGDCAEVSEGFELFLDWPYITGDDGGDRVFTFTNLDGFDVVEGTAEGRDKPTISLAARADSPAEATIEVFAHNACGESNRGVAPVRVRKELPHAFNPRVAPPSRIVGAATFTHGGKGYVIGGVIPGAAASEGPVWTYDPATNAWTEGPIAFSFGEDAAVVVGDELLVSRNHNDLTLRSLTTFATRRTLSIDNPFTPPFFTRVHLFAIGGLVYVGPIFRGSPYVYIYDPTNESLTQGPLLANGLAAAAEAAVAHGTRIFYFFDDGTGIAFDTVTSQAQTFSTPVGANDSFVTAFVVNDQPWVVTTKGYHRLDPVQRTLTRVDMFNGQTCFARGWPGPTHETASFVLGDRVYFVGGAETGHGPASYPFFLGARF